VGGGFWKGCFKLKIPEEGEKMRKGGKGPHLLDIRFGGCSSAGGLLRVTAFSAKTKKRKREGRQKPKGELLKGKTRQVGFEEGRVPVALKIKSTGNVGSRRAAQLRGEGRHLTSQKICGEMRDSTE